ncbi:unnamed protein product [Closterium sp. NIES-53]
MGCGGSKALAAVDNPPLPPPTKPVAPPSVTAAAPAAVVPSAAEKPAKPSQATTAALAAAPPATEVSSLAKDISSAASVAPSKQDPPVVLQESPPEAASDTVVDAPGEKAEAPAAVGLSADENGSAEFNRSAEAQQAQVGAADEDTGEAADGGSGRLAGEGGGSEAEQSGRVAEVGEGQEHDFSNRCSEDDGAIQSSHPSLREGEEGEEGVSAEAAAAAETAGAQDTCASAAAVADVAEARDSTDDLPEAGEAAGAAAADAAAAEATPAEAADGIASTADGSTGGDGESSSADATARSSMSSGSGVAVNNPRGGISGAKSGGIVSESRDSSAAAGGGGAPTSNSAGSGGGGGSAFLAHSAISRSLSNDRHRAHTPPLPPHHRPSTSSPLQGPNQHNHQQQQQQHGHSQPSSHSQEKTGPNQQQQQQQQQPVSNERIGSSLLGRSSSNRSLGRPSPQPSTPKQSPSPNHSASPQGMLRPAKSNPHNPLPSPRQPGTPLPRPPSPPMSPHGILRVPGSPAPLFGGMALPLPSPQSFGSSNLSGGSAGAVGGSGGTNIGSSGLGSGGGGGSFRRTGSGAGGGSGGGSGGVLPKSGSQQQQQQQQSQKQNQQQKSGSTGGGGGGGSNAGASSNNNNSSSSTVSTSGSMPRMPAITQQNAGNLRVFSYTELRAATGAFSRENLLGEGGFGGVYKGHVDAWPIDGVPIVMGQKIVVAVKRLNKDGLQGHKEWLAEVNFLGNIQHPRLVRLLGYCAEEEHRLLVYEFVPNKSLEDHLFKTNGAKGGPGLAWLDRIKVALDAAKGLAYLHDETENQGLLLLGYCVEEEDRLLVYEFVPNKSLEDHLFKTGGGNKGGPGLAWLDRIKVALDAAKGLAYLHDETENQVIFRDFKAANILLDNDLHTKLSDCCCCLVLTNHPYSTSSTYPSLRLQVVGTVGYAAPEYVLTGHLTARSDVWSYGVVLVELLTGRRALDESRPREEVFLVDWAKPYLAETRRLFRIMDPGFEGKYSAKASQKVAALALWCLAKNQKQRPTMTQVVESLTPLLDLTGSTAPPTPSSPSPLFSYPLLTPSPPLFPQPHPLPHTRQCRSVSIASPHHPFLPLLPSNRLPSFSLPSPFPPPPHLSPYPTPDNAGLSASPAPITPLRVPPASPMGFLNPGAGGGPGTPGGGGLGGGGLGTPGALGALAMRRAAGPPSPAGVGSFPPAQFNSLNPPPNARFSPRPPQLPVGKQQYTSPLVAALRVKERQHQQVQQQQQQQQQMQASNSAGAGGGAGGMAGGVGVEEGVDDGGGVGTVRERANVGRAVPLAIQVNRPRFGAGTNHERMEGVK